MPADIVTENVCSDFHRNGFAALPQFIEPGELEWLREIYDRLFDRFADTDPADRFDIAGNGAATRPPLLPQIIRPEKYAPELCDGSYFRRCRALAAALLGADAAELTHFGHAIVKPPRYGAATPWHQDEAYADPRYRYRALSIWTPLDPATPESGCLHFIPGRHDGPVLPHHHIDHNDRIRGLVTDDVHPADAVAVPLAEGDASVHAYRTPHYAGPNLTDRSRRAYVLVFMGPATVVADPEPRPWRTES